MQTFCPFHTFDVSYRDAMQIQAELRDRVEISRNMVDIDCIELIGGVDVAFIPNNPADTAPAGDTVHEYLQDDFPDAVSSLTARTRWNRSVTAVAAAVCYNRKRRTVIESVFATAPVFFPYVPGFLSFREGPAVLRAVGKLKTLPDAIVYDGCGIAHPRGLGLASHMALMTDIPSVGCAKSLLCGACDTLGVERGSWSDLRGQDDIIGACLRTRTGVKPVYVSPGSSFTIESSRQLILSLAQKYRLPEPTRLAHHFVTEQKKKIASL